ncbi:hypothetical protein E6P09_03125 [Haloferax mediterranei ATCC 33500]|uniref:N-acetyltransferase domain-containing protein n=1 Tax=Haloferax mediterranei (strain ATCC 33500 / DSM 1411 / JCM 8866 / NBRC 14739 / NCIMB 2177 / R-4) TaxID=523841 RepID=I3R0J1_HALMT|nr:hypothetical protein [Haloferax mediterranei]AFK17751.1 hypothetical protein HFX_0006 [Haloferax mediterranei ATCC 33500]AHZ22817.1 hypothetical protein BM92_09260 [Haloferax mediterranei ATCC 33500]EMA02977.1 hypothetical protein C439_10350 [Haloferax mediterranei ATCC 33500]MDX5987840.1 hypothetical protein [Haloferax mediterranei ATCC 33500]QCQ74316.1 hypothetical protein E6P09_03125 [Haloferax mediterranei ATCC 33500]
MKVRDAVDSDAEALAAVADAPERAMRRLIQDRTVRIATAETGADPNADTPAADDPVLGFVGFDVRDGVLHVTRLGGTEDAVQRLLEEPLRFANTEQLPVEVLVLESEEPLHTAVEHVGFERVGHGPDFDGTRTVRYYLDETN